MTITASQRPAAELPQPWRCTPLVESSILSKAAGCRIFLKLENLQPAGSFKSRGIGNLIRKALLNHPFPSQVHFFCSSGGNAGLACVTAASALGRPATVVVPLSTKPFMIAKIKAAGAYDVIQYGASWREADEFLREEVMNGVPGAVYVPPFDHPDIWDGHASLIDELDDKPDAIVCSVGGGGLFCGVQMGLQWRGWSDVPVLAMETGGCQSLHASLEAGQLVSLDDISTIATSLGAKRVAAKAFELGQRSNVTSVVLDDAEAAMGCWRLADDERLVVEPACGVSVAPCYNDRLKELLPSLNRDSKVVIVVCGGSLATLESLLEYKQQFGWIEAQLPQMKSIPSALLAQQSAKARALGHMMSRQEQPQSWEL